MNEFGNQRHSDDEMYFWLCQMARQVDTAILIIDPKKGYTINFANHIFTRLTEYSELDLMGNTLSTLYGPLTDLLNEQAIQESIENGLTFKTSSFHYRKDGSAFWNEVSNLPVRNLNGELQYSVLIMKDVTESINVESLIELERDVYFSLENGESIDEVLGNICSNVETTFGKKCHCSIVIHNKSNHSVKYYGEFADELITIDKNLHILDVREERQHLVKKPVIVRDIQSSNLSKKYKQLIDKFNLQSLWSQPILNTEGEVIGLFTMYFEQEAEPQEVDFKFLNRIAPIVTLALKYFEQKNAIRLLAYQDVSTGLNNLEQFKNTMNALIEHGCEGYLYIIEPGEYQKIVDIYGRQGGDEILRQLASRLQNVRTFEDSILARYTNSSIIVASRLGMKEIKISQQEREGILFEPYFIDNKEVYVTLKVGTSGFCETITLNEAIRQADTALSSAIKATGTVVKRFEEGLIESVEREMNVLAHIPHGLKNAEFFPMLQPKVNIETGKIKSFEALARWISADLGFVSPAQFIPVAENTGNIYKIDRDIFRKVLQWQKQRLETGFKMYQVSVNISPSHFYNPSFVEGSIKLIEQYGIDPQYIKFEITESIELENVMRAKRIINELNEYGIATSIDDFGVGYSSLSYLQQLPFEEIKIDKSFVDNLADPRMNAVIKTIIQLSNDLNMESVAEGIETEEQHLELKRLGCDIGQGYYYYKPMKLEDIDQLLEDQKLNI
ncbi:phosphodiesterase [Lysinibacillus sp. 2017]|uniref:bifunctional diguanylate cyclase/phosphodiesterase n=1 Tax=unclassified Lysinibacillus TaxID=2636778 RepID=UPI000D526BD4|nr:MULTISPECIES: EAL domain-containing protein [unclassified Lysinibacillus]AWE08104.1 phosphodiesterase [Lysinibacillus sp. 2017]TGN36392.1 phosphodiesterase [Lysinibacillus sp. S2017]